MLFAAIVRAVEALRVCRSKMRNRGVTLTTVHGNQGIMEAAARAKGNVKILAVTVLTSLDRESRMKRVAAALKLVGLEHRAKHRPRELSGGQEQRVGIARAIVTDPTLLLCDEPTGDLDRKSGDEILTLLEALNDEYGKTIIMVTHDPHAAERSNRTIHLDKGMLREDHA